MAQEEMFPKTELDEAMTILQHLEEEQEKADAAVTKAQDRAFDALTRVNKQRHVVKLLQKQMPAVDPVTGEVPA